MKQSIKKPLILNNEVLKRLIKIIDTEFDNVKLDLWMSNEYKLSEEYGKNLNFSASTLEKLMEIVNIEQVIKENKFEKWFSYKYEIKEEEENFLKELIKENIIYLSSFNEQTLITKFIAPVLNKIKFRNKNVKDWYEYGISCKLNNWTLNGHPDFFIATGINQPKIPYFFLQEYKKGVNPKSNLEYQVLAAMLATIELNNSNTIKGGYIIGQYWKFMILDKLENGNYEYFVSKGFDCLDFGELKKIYIYLQAVKHLYCK